MSPIPNFDNPVTWPIISVPPKNASCTKKNISMRPKSFLFLLVFIIITIQGRQLWGQSEVKNWELGGYVKDMQTLIILPPSSFFQNEAALFDNLVHNRINFGYYPDDRFSFEADLRNRFFWGDQIRLASATYIDELDKSNDFFKLSWGHSDSLGVAFHTMIDRLYLDYTIGNWQFRAGRQRINWGINTAWNPNDIFNAYSFTDFDYEEKPGSDAILIKYYFDFASSIEFAAKAFEKKEDAVAGILLKWNRWTYDMQLLGGIMQHNLVLGGGWAGNLFNAGFKGEFTYFKAMAKDEEDGFSMTLGLDYIFKNSLFANLGFLYNQNGNDDQSLAEIFSFDLSAKNLYPYTKALYASVNYPFTQLFYAGIVVVYSPVSTHPVFLSPTLSISLANELDLGLFGQLILEKDESFTSPVQAFFVRFKYSF